MRPVWISLGQVLKKIEIYEVFKCNQIIILIYIKFNNNKRSKRLIKTQQENINYPQQKKEKRNKVNY